MLSWPVRLRLIPHSWFLRESRLCFRRCDCSPGRFPRWPGASKPDVAADLAICANERVKTAILPLSELAAVEAACGRVMASGADDERQKAAFYRGLMRFLQVVQKGMDPKLKRDGRVAAYAAPTLDQVRPALADLELAIGLDGPLKGDAIAMRVTVNQTIGRDAEARSDSTSR